MLFYHTSVINAQRLETLETLTAKGQVNSQVFLPICYLANIDNQIILSSRTCSKNVGVTSTGQTILTGSNNNSDAYLVSFDENLEVKNSQIIQTPNGDAQEYVKSICYNKHNNFIYCSFSTTSDSIRFNMTMPWKKIIKKDINTPASFLIIYDTNLNYITSYPFSNYKGGGIDEIAIDKVGNIFIRGGYFDSLVFNSKSIAKNKSANGVSFLMKLNNTNGVEWIDEGVSSVTNLYINETRNSIYVAIGGNTIIYNNKDSIVFTSTKNGRTIIAEFASSTGHIKQFTSIQHSMNDQSLAGFNPIQFKGNDSTLVLNSYFAGLGLSKIKIGADSFSFYLSQTYHNNFINVFNAATLKHKFINFFDSCYDYLNITDVYNDSLYSITAATRGNQNFGFKGTSVFAKDYLKTRPIDVRSDFFATYTTSNRLKDLWYLSTKPNANYTFSNPAGILANNGNIYIGGNIPYHAELGLGKREFNYSSGSNRSMTLVKYNCMPTAYFSYSIADTKIIFKNLSTGDCSYTWLFDNKNVTAKTRDAFYEYPKSGGVFNPKLVVSNNCGTDTFSMPISISPSSLYFKNKIQFVVYPNPANSKLTVQFGNELKSENLYFYLSDIYGKEVGLSFYKIDEMNYGIDVQNLSNGIYTLMVKNSYFKISQKITIFK